MNLRKYYQVAEAVAQLSKDPRTKVGALIIDHRGCIRAVGYNGFPRNIEDDPARYENREIKLRMVAHAEANAIANAAAVGTPLYGCSIVVTKYPCRECAKLFINAGITKILTNDIEPGAWIDSCRDAKSMFNEAGLQVFIV